VGWEITNDQGIPSQQLTTNSGRSTSSGKTLRESLQESVAQRFMSGRSARVCEGTGSKFSGVGGEPAPDWKRGRLLETDSPAEATATGWGFRWGGRKGGECLCILSKQQQRKNY